MGKSKRDIVSYLRYNNGYMELEKGENYFCANKGLKIKGL